MVFVFCSDKRVDEKIWETPCFVRQALPLASRPSPPGRELYPAALIGGLVATALSSQVQHEWFIAKRRPAKNKAR